MDEDERPSRFERRLADDMVTLRHQNRQEVEARNLGWYMRDRREALGLTVNRAAAAADMDPTEWLIIEEGSARGVGLVLERIAKGLQVDATTVAQFLAESVRPAGDEVLAAADMAVRADARIRAKVEAVLPDENWASEDTSIRLADIWEILEELHEAALVLTEARGQEWTGLDQLKREHLARPGLRLVDPDETA